MTDKNAQEPSSTSLTAHQKHRKLVHKSTLTQVGQEIVLGTIRPSIAISADGTRVVVGDRNTGAGRVRVYNVAQNGLWTLLGNEIQGTSDDAGFGFTVTISANGNRIVVASQNDSARAYDLVNGAWEQVGRDLAWTPSQYVAFSADGNQVVTADTLYYFQDGDWERFLGGTGATEFQLVALSADGSRIVYGNSPNARQVRVFDVASFSYVGQTISSPSFIRGVAVSANGNRFAMGETSYDDSQANNRGRVRVFDLIGGSWVPVGNDILGEGENNFSGPVAMSADGNRIVVGAPGNQDGCNDQACLDSSWNPGQVRVYDLINGVWTQVGEDLDGVCDGTYEGCDDLGTAVAITPDGKTIVASGIRGLVRVYKINTHKDGGGGGDPLFQRWNGNERNTFHGECDLVMCVSLLIVIKFHAARLGVVLTLDFSLVVTQGTL